MKKSIKVAIADDHKLFRKGLISILKMRPDVEAVIEAENGKELMQYIVDDRPDALLLDLNMPEMSGWDVLAELKKKKIRVPVVIISMYAEEAVIVHAIKAGAVGYLSKNAEPDEIFLAIDSVIKNGFYFNDSTNKALLRKTLYESESQVAMSTGPIELEPRELQVLRYIALEMSTEEIATKMFLGTRTVENTRQKLLEKFGARNVAGLVVLASRRGFIQL